jgi:hypothetical protein
MKSRDIGVLVFVAVVSGILSILLSGLLIPSSERKQTVEVVEPITAEFSRPPKQYFNENSINPTQEIRIGQDEGSTPFSGN